MMAWRIGDILEPFEQLGWLREHRFDSVGFHASAGVEGQWRGIAPAHAGTSCRRELRNLLATFQTSEIHAPFACVVTPDPETAHLPLLREVLTFAGDVNATLVTIHAEPPPQHDHAANERMREVCRQLDREAARNGTVVGLETTHGFETIREWAMERVGITLDVGHMFLGNGAPLKAYHSLPELINRIGEALRNLHVHDVSAEGIDHIEPGTGIVPLHEIPRALQQIGYAGSLCLELNPDRVSPHGIVRGRDTIRRLVKSACEPA